MNDETVAEPTAESIPVERAIPIDPDGRYLVVLPSYATDEDAARAQMALSVWWASDEKFLLARGEITLYKMEPKANAV